MGSNEAINNFEKQQGNEDINPETVNDKFNGVKEKEYLSARIVSGNLGKFIEESKQRNNPHSIHMNGVNLSIRGSKGFDTTKKLQIVGIGKERQQETKQIIKGLLDIKTGPISIKSPNYNKVLNSVKTILNNNRLGLLNQLIGYTGLSVLNNGNQISINLQKFEDAGTTRGIRVYINKGNNRFSVIKNGQTIGVGNY